MERIPASERTREKLKALMGGDGETMDARSELVRLAARLIIEEALESEASDALGRGYYARSATPGSGYRNGYRTGRLGTAEGAVEFSAPQIADRAEPFRSRIRAILGSRTAELEALAIEMYARGLSVRDIEALFADERGRSLLSRTAVSEITERLWAEYEAFASRDLSEFEVVYLFVDGRTAASRPAARGGAGRLGHPRRWQEGAAAPGAGHQGGHDELSRVLPRHAPARASRSAAGGLGRRPRRDPRDRGMLPTRGPATLPRAQDAQSAEQGAR
jgi:mutator family transposase